MESLAIALLIILLLVIMEVISMARTKKPKLDLPAIKSKKACEKDELTEYLISREWKNKARKFKEEFTK